MRRVLIIVLGVTLLAIGAGTYWVGWPALWASPDQRGRFLYERQDFAGAAQAFRAPIWRGVALMRAGDFKAAADILSGVDTAEGAYDHGNALVMLGKYAEAAARYDHALALRPGWREASDNRALALLRAEMLKAPGGDSGDQQEGADQIVYDKDAKSGGQPTEIAGKAMSDSAVRALWLKRVQTRPADFLRARFAYQLEALKP